jgi:hypothetical protein
MTTLHYSTPVCLYGVPVDTILILLNIVVGGCWYAAVKIPKDYLSNSEKYQHLRELFFKPICSEFFHNLKHIYKEVSKLK